MAKTGLYANIHAKQERIAKEKAEGKPKASCSKPKDRERCWEKGKFLCKDGGSCSKGKGAG